MRRLAIPLIALLLVSCGPKNPIPTTQQTSLQRVIVLNAAVAKANLALTQTAQTLNTSGVLTVPQTRTVLTISLHVAQTSDTIRVLTSGPGDWPSIAAGVTKALNDLGLTARITAAGLTNQQLVAAVNGVAAAVALIQAEVSR